MYACAADLPQSDCSAGVLPTSVLGKAPDTESFHITQVMHVQDMLCLSDEQVHDLMFLRRVCC